MTNVIQLPNRLDNEPHFNVWAMCLECPKCLKCKSFASLIPNEYLEAHGDKYE